MRRGCSLSVGRRAFSAAEPLFPMPGLFVKAPLSSCLRLAPGGGLGPQIEIGLLLVPEWIQAAALQSLTATPGLSIGEVPFSRHRAGFPLFPPEKP